jgi:hypothetical protein
MRTAGSVAFAALGGGVVQWGQRLGVSGKSVSKYRRGEAVPRPAVRELIHELGGPAPSAWDEPLPFPEPVVPRAVPVVPADGPEVRAFADELLQYVRQELAALQGDALAEPSARARQLRDLTQSVTQLGKLTDVGLVLSTRQILASPNWAQIKGAIVAALEAHPDAMTAVVEALQNIEG